MTTIITIDGPSGSGKGTISRIIAEEFGLALLDSGAIYRLAALAALTSGTAVDDAAALETLAENLDIEFKIEGGGTVSLLAGVDVSSAIREEETGMAAASVASIPGVRSALLARQRAFAVGAGVVADGRDMGTVVFPQAQYKFYLTASSKERAKRRVLQLEASGAQDVDFDTILADIQARDAQDMGRATAPLRPAEDAVQIDSTALDIDEVVQVIRRTVSSSSNNI